MSIKGAHLGILAAVLLASGAGFVIARVFDPHATGVAEDPHTPDEHGEE